jgi:hypothetical protein
MNQFVLPGPETTIFIFIFFYSGGDASHPEVCFILQYTEIFPGPIQETLSEAGFELGTAA